MALFEVWRGDAIVMQTNSEKCIPDKTVQKSIKDAGLKIKRDGKLIRESKETGGENK